MSDIPQNHRPLTPQDESSKAGPSPKTAALVGALTLATLLTVITGLDKAYPEAAKAPRIQNQKRQARTFSLGQAFKKSLDFIGHQMGMVSNQPTISKDKFISGLQNFVDPKSPAQHSQAKKSNGTGFIYAPPLHEEMGPPKSLFTAKIEAEKKTQTSTPSYRRSAKNRKSDLFPDGRIKMTGPLLGFGDLHAPVLPPAAPANLSENPDIESDPVFVDVVEALEAWRDPVKWNKFKEKFTGANENVPRKIADALARYLKQKDRGIKSNPFYNGEVLNILLKAEALQGLPADIAQSQPVAVNPAPNLDNACPEPMPVIVPDDDHGLHDNKEQPPVKMDVAGMQEEIRTERFNMGLIAPMNHPGQPFTISARPYAAADHNIIHEDTGWVNLLGKGTHEIESELIKQFGSYDSRGKGGHFLTDVIAYQRSHNELKMLVQLPGGTDDMGRIKCAKIICKQEPGSSAKFKLAGMPVNASTEDRLAAAYKMIDAAKASGHCGKRMTVRNVDPQLQNSIRRYAAANGFPDVAFLTPPPAVELELDPDIVRMAQRRSFSIPAVA